jgi:serine/threonine protein phosphatase PrpC
VQSSKQLETVIYCAHIGDSRAIVVGRDRARVEFQIFELSEDHRADDPIERDRITARGGTIEHYRDYKGMKVGPARVWLPDFSAPGLAMSRSFGDRVAHSVGVISEPSIKKYHVRTDDLFVVMGSDGVWQYLSNEEVTNENAIIRWPRWSMKATRMALWRRPLSD